MYCSNCGAKIDDPNQEYCDLCGNELINISDIKNEDTKVNPRPIRSKRRCC
ncbi:MAG: zinc-ribbon domain-containing protein [Candidatus Odinarchaeota archaeon]